MTKSKADEYIGKFVDVYLQEYDNKARTGIFHKGGDEGFGEEDYTFTLKNYYFVVEPFTNKIVDSFVFKASQIKKIKIRR